MTRGHGGILSAVPVELFLLIHSYLLKVSQVQLGLACKAYFTTLYPRSRIPLSDRDKVELLLSLEKDIPERSWCPYCNRLCRFKSTSEERWMDQDHATLCEGLIEVIDGENFNRPPESKFNLVDIGVHFVDAHLVMTARLYGERHGLPISVMNNGYSDEYEVFPWYQDIPLRPIGRSASQSATQEVTTSRQGEVKQGDNSTRTAQLQGKAPSPSLRKKWRISRQQMTIIIKGEFYVSVRHMASAPSGLSYMLTTLLRCWDIPLCYHLTFSQALICIEDTGLYYVFEQRLDPCDDKVVSCMACYTDVSITVRDAPRHPETDFEIITYHRLGRCRRPDDDVWKTITLPPGAMRTAEMRSANAVYPPGEVQNQWKMSEDVYERPSKLSWGIPGAYLTGSFIRPDSFWLD